MALHNKTNFYFMIPEDQSTVLNKNLSDATYPEWAALFPYYELVDDGEGNMVPAANPTPNATFYDRIRYNFRKTSDVNYPTEITNINIAQNVFELQVLPQEPIRMYIALPIRIPLNKSITDFVNENDAMRAAIEGLLGRTFQDFQFGLITDEQLAQYFSKVEG